MTQERAQQIIKDSMRPRYMALMDKKEDVKRRADELEEELEEMRERLASERGAWERELEELTEEMLALEFEVDFPCWPPGALERHLRLGKNRLWKDETPCRAAQRHR
jgi:hypothetical protein